MKKDVMIVIGAGQIGMAIARRAGSGMKIFMGDSRIGNAEQSARTMNEAGFDVTALTVDLASRESIVHMLREAEDAGRITKLINAAGVSPSQASVKTIFSVDLYGTAVLLEEAGRVIAPGGAGVTISSQSGFRMPPLRPEEDRLLALTPPEELLDLEFLREENVRDTLRAYQLAKRCNEKRVMAEAVNWGQRQARINAVAPGIIVTPLALDEFQGPRGDFYRNMFAKCPAGRPGTPDEVGEMGEFLLSSRASYITGSTILMDGGATASWYYGPLHEEG